MNKAGANKHIDIRYTKTLSIPERGARNAKDFGHNVFVVGFGNAALGVVNMVKLTFGTADKLPRFKSLHRQRMDARKHCEIPMQRHFKDQDAVEKQNAALQQQALERSNKTRDQPEFEAQVKLFAYVASARQRGDGAELFPVADLNKCVISGLRDMFQAGVISQEELDDAEVTRQGKIYKENDGRFGGELQLPGYGAGDMKCDQCRAAIARRYIEAGLVSKEMLAAAGFSTISMRQSSSGESSSQETIEVDL